jgi:hypothetical protein
MNGGIPPLCLIHYGVHRNNFTLACTGDTQKNGAVLIVLNIKNAPLFCVCPVQLTVLTLFNQQFKKQD